MRKKEANSEIALIGLFWLHDYSCTEEEYFTIVYLNLTKGNMFLCAKVFPCAIQRLFPFEKKKKKEQQRQQHQQQQQQQTNEESRKDQALRNLS